MIYSVLISGDDPAVELKGDPKLLAHDAIVPPGSAVVKEVPIVGASEGEPPVRS